MENDKVIKKKLHSVPMFLTPACTFQATMKEFDDYTYFWRVIGWCLGLRDEYNICGTSASVAKTISEEVEQEIIVPGLRNPSPQFKLLCGDFVKGMKPVIPGFNAAGIDKYLFPRMGLKPPILSFFQWFYYLFLVVSCWLCFHVPIMRCFFNVAYKYVLMFMIWMYAR